MSKNLTSVLEELSTINGFIAAAVASAESGMALGVIGGNESFNVEIAAAANTDVIKAKLLAIDALGFKNDRIEDMLITLSTQYHLIRPCQNNPLVFIYLAVDKAKANLALARHSLSNAEKKLNM